MLTKAWKNEVLHVYLYQTCRMCSESGMHFCAACITKSDHLIWVQTAIKCQMAMYNKMNLTSGFIIKYSGISQNKKIISRILA